MTRTFNMEEFVLDRALPIGLFIVSIAIGLTRFGGALNIAFPIMATFVAIILYYNKPLGYLSFALWIWMLTPFIRRLSDFQGEYHTVSILLIAPLAVTIVSAASVLRYRDRLDSRLLLPLFVMLIILVYGFFIGALKGGFASAALGLANWGVPVVFAIHVLILPEDGIDKARVMLRALIFGGIVIGGYGIFQFVALPPWDVYWMESSDLTSIGQPFAFSVRVFSTLNSPGPFAQYIAAASLAAFTTYSRVRLPSMMLAIISLLLTLVRATWGAWFISLLLLYYLAPRNQKAGYVGVALAASIIITPIVAITPLGTTIGDRIAKLSSGSEDDSYMERQALYASFTRTALTSVTGVGLGQTSVIAGRLDSDRYVSEVTTIDSGLLETFYSLGLLATIYFGAIGVLTMRAWPRSSEPFTIALFIVAFVNIPIMIFGNSFVSPTGMLFYPFLAAAIAAKSPKMSGGAKSRRLAKMDPVDGGA